MKKIYTATLFHISKKNAQTVILQAVCTGMEV